MSGAGPTYTFLRPRVTPVVRALLWSTVGVFLLQLVVDARTAHGFTRMFGLSCPSLLDGAVWQLGTYMFLHGGIWHILINMVVLALFGSDMERVLGSRSFLSLYFTAGILGGLGWVLLSCRGYGLCIGASGAVFGIVGAFAAMFPDRRVTLLVFFVLPVTMRARTLALLLAGITLVSLLAGDGRVAHTAHLAGGVAGYAWGVRAAGRGRRRRRSRRAARQGFRVIEEPESVPEPSEVNRILDKVTTGGLKSLTRDERRTLERAGGRRPES